MEPTPASQPPTPDPHTLPTNGTPDTQRSDADTGTNLPPPDNTPAAAAPATAPDSETDSSSTTSQASAEVATGPSTNLQSDTGGEADPSASNTSNDEPL